MALAMLAILLFLSEPVQSTGLEGPFSRLGFAPCAPCSVAPGRNGAAATCGRTASIRTAPMPPRMLGSPHTSVSFAGVVPAGGPTGPWLWGRGSAAAGVALAAAVSPVIEPVEDEFDYRSADLMGTRLFVTGLPATVRCPTRDHCDPRGVLGGGPGRRWAGPAERAACCGWERVLLHAR